METNNSSFEGIAPTAVWTAYLRSFSDIPFSQEIYEELSRIEYGNDAAAPLKKPDVAPQYEARYKIITRLILSTGIDQVLELAAGFTGRGLALAEIYPIHYIEMAIPSVAHAKQKLIRKLFRNQPVGELEVLPGNALSQDDVGSATSRFDKRRRVLVVNEGLMRYLTFPQKAVLASNIHAILVRHGGAWITPDISLRTLLAKEDEALEGHTDKLTEITGKDIRDNLFDNVEHAIMFFNGLGFNVERHSLLEVADELASPAALGLSSRQVVGMLEPAAVFVMNAT